MQQIDNDKDLASAVREHGEAANEATRALEAVTAVGSTPPPDVTVDAQPRRVMRYALFTTDVPWPNGRDVKELEVDVPLPAEIVGAFFVMARPNPLLVEPGKDPQPIALMRIAFNCSPDSERVKRHLIAQPAGAAIGFPEDMPDSMKPVMVEVVSNPLTGSIIALWIDPPDPNEPPPAFQQVVVESAEAPQAIES